MDREKLLNQAIDLQGQKPITLAQAIETVVCDYLIQVAGSFTSQAARNHIGDVTRLARSRGYIVN